MVFGLDTPLYVYTSPRICPCVVFGTFYKMLKKLVSSLSSESLTVPTCLVRALNKQTNNKTKSFSRDLPWKGKYYLLL